jgi:hypothetical protein
MFSESAGIRVYRGFIPGSFWRGEANYPGLPPACKERGA